MLTLEREVSKRLTAMMAASLPYQTGEPMKQCSLSPSMRKYRTFLAGSVDRGDFEIMLRSLLATLTTIVEETGLTLATRRQHCSHCHHHRSGRSGGSRPRRRTTDASLSDNGDNASLSSGGHKSHQSHQSHQSHRDRSVENQSNDAKNATKSCTARKVAFEVSKRHQLRPVLESVLLVCDCILLAMTLQLGAANANTCCLQLQELIDGNNSLQPLVYSLLWSNVLRKGVAIPPMDTELCDDVLSQFMKLLPPNIIRSFWGASRDEALEVEMPLLDAMLSISHFAACASPPTYLAYVDRALKACHQATEGGAVQAQVLDVHNRLEILVVHAPNPDVFGIVLGRALAILSNVGTTLLTRDYIKMLLVGSLTRAVSHSTVVVDLWKPELVPMIDVMDQLLREFEATEAAKAELLAIERLKIVEQEQQPVAQALGVPVAVPAVSMATFGDWCPIDALLISFMAITIPGTAGLDRLKVRWDEQAEKLNSSVRAVRLRACCYFTEMAYAAWTGVLRIHDKRPYEQVAAWLLELLPLVKERMSEGASLVAPIKRVKLDLFCSKFAPDTIKVELYRDIRKSGSVELQHQFLQMLQALFDFGTVTEFWRQYEDLQPIFIAVLLRASETDNEELLGSALDLLMRSRRLLAKSPPEEILKVVDSLASFMARANEAAQVRVIESLVFIFNYFKDDAQLSAKLTQKLVGPLQAQADLLLVPRIEWNLDFVHRVLLLLTVKLEDQSVMRSIRVGLLLALFSANPTTCFMALDCLGELQSQPYSYEMNREFVGELLETDHNKLASSVVVQKRLVNFLSRGGVSSTPMLEALITKIHEFVTTIHAEQGATLDIGTEAGRTFANLVRAYIASMALVSDPDERQSRMRKILSPEGPGVHNFAWHVRLSPQIATEFLGIMAEGIPTMLNDADGNLTEKKFVSAVGILCLLVDVAAPPLPVEPYALVETLLEIATKNFADELDANKRVLKLVHVVASRCELSPRYKTTGLSKVMETILSRFCTPDTDSDLLEAALRTLQQIFTDFVLDLNEYKQFDEIARRISHLYSVERAVPYLTQTLSPLLQANLEMTSVLVVDPTITPRLRAALYQAFSLSFTSDTAAERGTHANRAEFERRDALRAFLMKYPSVLAVLCDVCPPSEGDQLCRAVAHALPRYETMVKLVAHEVEHATDVNDVFRANSNSNRIIMDGLRELSSRWLKDLLAGFFRSVEPRLASFSKDTALQVSIEFEERLTDAVATLPTDVRCLLRYTDEACRTKLGGSGLTSIYTMFTLRLVCPALLSPPPSVFKNEFAVRETLPLYTRAVAVHLQQARATAPYLKLIVAPVTKESTKGTKQGTKPALEVDTTVTTTTTTTTTTTKRASPSSPTTKTYYTHSDSDSSDSTELTTVSSNGTHPQPPEECPEANTACSCLHHLLYRHGAEVKHVLLAAKDLQTIEELHNLIRLIGRPFLVDSIMDGLRSSLRPVNIEDEPNALGAKIIEFRGMPAHLSTSRTMARVNPGVPAFVYWFYRFVREALSVRPDDKFAIFADQSGGCVEPRLWEAKLEQVACLPRDIMSRFDHLYILNYPYFLYASSSLPAEVGGMCDVLTGFDVHPDELAEAGFSKWTVAAVRDLQSSTKFQNIEACCQGSSEIVAFDVYCGQTYVQFLKHHPGGIWTNDVFTYEEVVGESCSRFVSVRGSTEYEFVLSSAPIALKRRLNSGRRRVAATTKGSAFMADPSQRRGSAPKLSASAAEAESWRRNVANLVLLCLTDMRSPLPFVREAAYQLYALLPMRFGINVGLPRLSPDELNVLQLSEYSANAQPELAADVVSIFLTQGPRMSDMAKVVAPWFAHLAPEAAPKLISQLIAVTNDEILEHIWPKVSGHDEIVFDAVADAAVEVALQNQPLEKYQAIIASRDFKPYRLATKRMRALLKSDTVCTCKKWSEHPNWAEIEVLMALMAASQPPRLMQGNVVDEEMLVEICFVVLVFTGVGSYRFRLAVQQVVSAVVTSLVNRASTDALGDAAEYAPGEYSQDNVETRSRALWAAIQSPHGQVLFGAQRESQSWTYDSWTEFRPEMIEHLSKLVTELCMTVCGKQVAQFRWVRLTTVKRLLEHVSVVFPALQYRCILGMHGVLRFRMPDSVPEKLMEVLRRILAECTDTETAEVLSLTALRTMADLVTGLGDNSKMPARLAWVAIGFMSTGHLSLLVPAQTLLIKCIKYLNYGGVFGHKSLDVVLLESLPDDVIRWWREDAALNGRLHTLPLTRANFYVALAELLIPGLQHTRSQAVTLDLCDLLATVCRGPKAVPFVLFEYMVTSDVARLQSLVSLTASAVKANSITALQGGLEKFLAELATYLTEQANSSDPTVLMALVQGCKIAGFSSSMNFVTTGPRLMEVVCSITCRRRIMMLSPLLGPLIMRLLQLQQGDLNFKIMEWSMSVLSQNNEERKWLEPNRIALQELIAKLGLPVAVSETYKLIPNTTTESLGREQCLALSTLEGMLLN